MRLRHDFDALAGLLLVRPKVSAGAGSGLLKIGCSDGRERLGSHSRNCRISFHSSEIVAGFNKCEANVQRFAQV